MRLFTILGVVFLVLGVGLAAMAMLPGSGLFWDEFRNEGAFIAALTFIPMGIIFTAIGVYFGRLTAGRKRLLREGIPGKATILSLSGGNMVVNNINYMISFRLRVMLPGRAAYAVDHRQLVPIFSLATLPVGATVPVMVDPKDQAKLTIDLAGEAAGMRPVMAAAPGAQVVPNTLSTMQGSAPNTFTADLGPAAQGWPAMPQATPGMPGAVGTPGAVGAPGVAPQPGYPVVTAATMGGLGGATLSLVMDQLARSGISIDPSLLTQGSVTVGQATLDASPTGQAANAALLANGRPGTAFIREASDTGIDVHGDSVVELTLDVTPQGGTPYEVRTATLVPSAARARALPGTTIPVRIDTAQPSSVAIDWLH
jgi:hypothetical protein